MPEEDRTADIGNMHTRFGEDWTCSSGDMLVYRQTDKHGHHNTPLC